MFMLSYTLLNFMFRNWLNVSVMFCGSLGGILGNRDPLKGTRQLSHVRFSDQDMTTLVICLYATQHKLIDRNCMTYSWLDVLWISTTKVSFKIVKKEPYSKASLTRPNKESFDQTPKSWKSHLELIYFRSFPRFHLK